MPPAEPLEHGVDADVTEGVELPQRRRARDAFGPGSHGRRATDQIGWWLTAVKSVGFPIVVAWYLLSSLPSQIKQVLDSERSYRDEQHKALMQTLTASTDAINKMGQAVMENTAADASKRAVQAAIEDERRRVEDRDKAFRDALERMRVDMKAQQRLAK